MKRFLLIVMALFVLGGALGTFFFFRGEMPPEEEATVSPGAEMPVVTEKKVVEIPVVPAPTMQPKLPESVLIPDVPFTVQAPNAEWSNPLFQDACEEASVVMVQAWVEGKSLTKVFATKEIEALARLEKKEFGHAIDTSIEDTMWLLARYSGITSSKIEKGVDITDIREALASNKLVIVPTDGRKLKNPNFKQPGPSRHMLVIIGYDMATKEFIVNDPGTRRGEGYRYSEDVLYEAILDYATGDHVPVTSTDKVMLMVGQD